MHRSPNMSAPASSRILTVDGLGVSIDGMTILHGVSFGVARGELLAIVGPNGSGKTVLLRTLIGLLHHTGTIAWAPDTRIGYVPQKLDLDRDLPVTASDVLRARARISRLSEARVRETVARVGLAPDVLRRPVGALSGGQFQRMLIALALIVEPTVLLLDEPASGVDEPGQRRVNDVLHGLREHGVSILMISHDLSVVTRLAARVLCLTRNHRCLDLPTRALTHDVIADIYGEPVGLLVHDDSRA